MTIITGHGSDAVADSGNEKARWAGTHRARFVFTPAATLAPASHGQTSETAQPIGVTDGIDILRQHP